MKERTNISELKHMSCKILNEEVDSHASQQDKNSMEGSESECSETNASSWTKEVELPNFLENNEETNHYIIYFLG